MLSRLCAVAGVAVLAWTGSVWALGLGRIKVESKLNQPLVATIPISSSTPAELDSLVVALADNEDFERAGLERPEFLSSLSFEIDGSTIRVRSKEIARDPFVTFLLDLRWRGGHLLREYTLLLDPPTLAQAPPPDQPPPPDAPAAESPPEVLAEPGAAAEPAEVSADAASAEPPPAEAAPASTPAQATPPAPAPVASGPDTYGPVLPKETLWSIAYKLRPDPNSITMDQMQVALLNANPEAFKDGQLNQLQKGATLRIPDADEIRAVDPVAAKAQVAAARNATTPAPVVAQPAPERAPPPEPVAQAEPEPEPAPPPPPPAEPPPEPVAEAEPPPAEASAPEPAAQAPESEPETQTAAAPPPSEAPAEEGTAPEAPEEMAQAEPSAEPEPAEEPEPAPLPEPAKPVKVESPGIVDVVIDVGKGLVDSPFFIPAAAGILILILGALGFNRLRDKIAQWRYNRETKRLEEQSATADKTQVDKTEIESVDDQAPTVMNPEAGDAEAPAVGETAAMDAGAGQAGDTAAMEAAPPTEATMQQTMKEEPDDASSSGARPVDFDVTGQYASETVQINLDAGDPVSEAEFHRAYGLYDEAALLLKQALEKDPNRVDAKVKLAEIYFEASKSSEFVATATELKDQLPPEEWSKIALMGSQLAPDEALFSDASAGGAGTVDLSFDEPADAAPEAAPSEPAPAPAAEPAAEAPAAEDSGMLDFKLDEADTPAAETPAEAAPEPAKDEGGGDALEFDLDSLSLDTPSEEAAPEAEAAPAPSADKPADEELSLDLAETSAAPPADDPLAELEAAAESEPTAEEPAAEASAEPSADSLGDLDLGDFDIGDAAPADAGDAAADAGGGEGDDASTKLDLARAYADMGDNDMAKGLLNEVMQQGNDEQKKEAEELLQRVQA